MSTELEAFTEAFAKLAQDMTSRRNSMSLPDLSSRMKLPESKVNKAIAKPLKPPKPEKPAPSPLTLS